MTELAGFDHRAAWGVDIGFWDKPDNTKGFPSLDDGNLIFWDLPHQDGSLELFGRENVNAPAPWWRVSLSPEEKPAMLKELAEHMDERQGLSWFEKRGERFEAGAPLPKEEKR